MNTNHRKQQCFSYHKKKNNRKGKTRPLPQFQIDIKTAVQFQNYVLLMLQTGVEKDILQIMDLKKKNKLKMSPSCCAHWMTESTFTFIVLSKSSAAQRSLYFFSPLSLEIMSLLPRIKIGKQWKIQPLNCTKSFLYRKQLLFHTDILLFLSLPTPHPKHFLGE